MTTLNRVGELSLLIYLTTINHVSLPKIMAKWNGYTDEEYYNDKKVQIELYEQTLCDISRIYHIPFLLSKYFEAKKTQKIFNLFNGKYTEIDCLKSPLFWITNDIWSDEDRKRLKELKKEYIDEAESEQIHKNKRWKNN